MSLLQRSAAGGVLILLIVVIRALAIHRLPKTAFLGLWLIAALRLLLPFSIPLPSGVHIGRDIFSFAAQEVPSGNIDFSLPGEYGTGAAAPGPAAGNNSVFGILWLVGVLVLAFYFSVSYFRSIRKFKMSIPDNTPYVRNWLAAHPISRPLAVRSSDLISSPLTYGILRPVILLPKKLDRNDQAALTYVLAHEYVHVRRFDAITKILFAAVLCVHWFNPLVWVMFVLLNRDMELACDETVIKSYGFHMRVPYAKLLIRMEEVKNCGTIANYFSKNSVEERIVAIMKAKKYSVAALLFALVLVLGATVVFAIGPDNSVSSDPILIEAEDVTSPGELLSVNLEDESKFTAEEWADIMERVEAGEVLLFDTLEEESDYYLELWQSEQEKTPAEAEDVAAQD